MPRLGVNVADRLLEQLEADPDLPGARELLQVVLKHIADGGIAIAHDGSIVLTWTDGGASRRVTRSGDA